jgi:hypothetical protein
LSKKQATAGKTQKTFPQTLYVCAQLATAKNTNLVWKRGLSSLYPYSQAGAHVDSTANQNKTLPFLFNINQPMSDDQFIFSSFWLPSPKFELQTLAGYTNM